MKKTVKAVDATIASTLNTTPTFIEIIIDETGSMGPYAQSTIDAYNSFIRDQKELGGDHCLVTMTQFSTYKISTPYDMIALAMVPELDAKSFQPTGGTNLYDVMVQRINALSTKIKNTECNVVFLVLTDGEDNQSEIKVTQMPSILGERMEAGWTFVYLGAHDRALSEATRMGFPTGNVKAFKITDIAKSFQQTSNATSAYRSARSAGLVASNTTSLNYFSGE